MSCRRRCRVALFVPNGGFPTFVLLLCILLLVAGRGDCHHRRRESWRREEENDGSRKRMEMRQGLGMMTGLGLGFMQRLENFFCSVDQDGDGEIEHHEVTKFLSSFNARMNSVEEPNDGEGGGKDAIQDFITSYNFKGDFSYGGTTISAEEMLDHLQNMLTADRVVDWITHGLQLPQYAQAFRQNAVNGLDFPALIEDHSQTLSDELGVQSSFHRKKITHAIVRQMFGLGAVPGPPLHVQCASSRCGTILLHWDSPSFCGYPPLHKYLIQKRADNASSWMPICDIIENSFLDYNGILPGKFYAYRIQAWGGHGPSEWVQVHGCHSADTLSSDEDCYPPPVVETADIMSFVQVDALPRNGQISSSDSKVLNVPQRTASWAWMYLVNGFLLILGIISRHSIFFHITSAGWILFRKVVLSNMKRSLMEAQNSQYLLIRIVGHTFVRVCAFWQLMQASISNLSGQINGIHSRTSVVPPWSAPSRNFITDTDNYYGAIGCSTTDNSLEDMIVAQDNAFSSDDFLGKEGWTPTLNKIQCADSLQTKMDWDIDGPRNSVLLGAQFLMGRGLENPIKSNPDFMNERIVHGKNTHKVKSTMTTRYGKHLSVDDCRQENVIMQSCEKAETCTEPSSVSIRASDCRRKEELFTVLHRNRFRCNFEGCKVRFDRWHSLTDWQMKFRKHYCRECQRVFCIKHTRISPHGPFGQCGLESNCVCACCFVGLSLEAQQKLEQMNKLRAGPYVSNDTFHHEQKWRTNPILSTAPSNTKVQKNGHLIKDDWFEAKHGSYLGRNNVNDSYPPNLHVPFSDDSSDDSLSDSSCISSRSSSCSYKITSKSSDSGCSSSKMPSEAFECMLKNIF